MKLVGWVDAVGFCRGRIRTRMRWIKYDMRSKQEAVTVAGFITTRRMAPLSGTYSPLLLSKTKMERPSNSLGKSVFFILFVNCNLDPY